MAAPAPPKNLPVTVRNDVYDAISPEQYFNGTSTAFHGKVVIVAGGSKSIGLSIAKFYARAGAIVVIVARSEGTLADAKKQILAETSGKAEVLTLSADVVETKAVEELVGKVVDKYGKIDIVVQSSGITGGPWKKPFVERDPYEDWWKVFEVNVRGTYNMAHYVYPHLSKTNGTFAAFSTISVQRNLPGASAYASSKVALGRFIEFAAIEHPNVKSFTFNPGTIRTDGSVGAFPEWASKMNDTLELPAATILRLTDGSGKFDFLSGRFVSSTWDLEEVERDWKEEIIKKNLLVTRFDV